MQTDVHIDIPYLSTQVSIHEFLQTYQSIVFLETTIKARFRYKMYISVVQANMGKKFLKPAASQGCPCYTILTRRLCAEKNKEI